MVSWAAEWQSLMAAGVRQLMCNVEELEKQKLSKVSYILAYCKVPVPPFLY
jgi:hypothetical protein